MSPQFLPDQVAEGHNEKLGPQFGKAYNYIWNEVCRLHLTWQQYEQLFRVSEEQIQVLNYFAARFFRTVQDVFIDDVILHICRLTDSEKGSGKKRLSLNYLVRFLAQSDVEGEYLKKLKVLLQCSEKMRTQRNQRIAHTSLNVALGMNQEVLPGISISDVSDVIKCIDDVVNVIENRWLGGATSFNVLSMGSAEQLAYFLQKQYKARRSTTV